MIFGYCRYGKRFNMLCERINELELQIEFAKQFQLDYSVQEKEIQKLYKMLDRRNNDG